MLKRLRIKMMLVTMGILLAVLVVIGAAVFVSMYSRETIRAYEELERMAEKPQGDSPFLPGGQNGGGLDGDGQANPFQSRCFIAESENGTVTIMEYDERDYSEEEILSIFAKAAQSGKERGRSGQYYFIRTENGGKIRITAIDRGIEAETRGEMLLTILIAGGAGYLVLAVIVWFLSGWTVRPVKDAFDRQNQFIGDASHEFKTPLTAILANIDVLGEEIGENKWLSNIESQAVRMKEMTGSLLEITRFNELPLEPAETVELETLLKETAAPFEPLAVQKNIAFRIVTENIVVSGNAKELSRGMGILLDNAVKYTEPGGEIDISLGKADNRPVIRVYNMASGVKESEKDKLFDRFYRSDTSRSRLTGGSGLGLSILKTLAERNGWKLAVDVIEGESITFSVKL